MFLFRFLTGNPCCDFEGYRDFVIATLPQLKVIKAWVHFNIVGEYNNGPLFLLLGKCVKLQWTLCPSLSELTDVV